MSTDPPEHTTADRVAELERRRAEALGMGGERRVERHHASGRLTARERLDLLVDADSFFEIGLLADAQFRRDELAAADGVVGGFARIDGRKVCVLAVDATVMAGTTGQVNMLKQNRLAAFAGRKGLPLVCLSDNDGGRIPDVMGWRFSGLPFDFATFVQAPPGYPEIPRLAAVVGASFGDSALHASMGHYVVITEQASIALVGPPIVSAAIGEEVTAGELGGPPVATEVNGYAHLAVTDDAAAIEALKRALSYLPDHADAPAPAVAPASPSRDAEQLLAFVPTDPRRGYDIRRVLEAIVDSDSLFPWKERYGPGLWSGFARLDGQAVGVLASQPLYRAGALDVPALTKLAQFADLCDTFNLPLVFFQDVPGLMVGSDAERNGILSAYERVVARLARATVPKIVVVVRKAYGGGHFALGGRPTHPDLILAWPTAELGFMAPETGVRTVYKRRLEEALAQGGDAAHAALLDELRAEWEHESEPWEAAKHLFVDDVIDPRTTREALIGGIDFSWGNGPRIARRRA